MSVGPGRGLASQADRDARRYTPADLAAARAEGYADGVEDYHQAVLSFFRRAWNEYPIDAAAQTALRRALYTLADRQMGRAQTLPGSPVLSQIRHRRALCDQ